MSNSSDLKVGGKSLKLTQSTGYPWDGDVRLDMAPKGKQDFTLKIRVPGWVRGEVVPSDLYMFSDGKQLGYSVKVNGEPVESNLDKGYFSITRQWKKGDVVEVHFDMEPRMVKANVKVEADRGRVAVERGPVVYCAEWPDNSFGVMNVLMNRKPAFYGQNANLIYCMVSMRSRRRQQALSYGRTASFC